MNKLSIPRDALLKGLSSVAGVVERKQTLPILGNVLIEPKDGLLCLTASDMEIQMRHEVAIDRELAGGKEIAPFTVNARKLSEILRASAGETVDLQWDAGKCTVKCGKSRFSLLTLPAEDFPLVKAASDYSDEPLVVEQGVCKRALGRTQFAMAVHDIRFYLNGMLLAIDARKFAVVATDGHRLAIEQSEAGQEMEDRSVILPRKAVAEMLRLMGDGKDKVEIRFASNQVRVAFGSTEMVSKLIEGKFPDYQRVLPKQNGVQVEMERAVLLGALQRVAIMTSDKFKGVLLRFSNGLLSISSKNAENEEGTEEVEIDYQGADIEVGFNVAYLLDALSTIDSEKVRLFLRDSASSMLVRIPDEDGFQYVVMPMRI